MQELTGAEILGLEAGDEVEVSYVSRRGNDDTKVIAFEVANVTDNSVGGFAFGTVELRAGDDIPRRRLNVRTDDVDFESRSAKSDGGVSWSIISELFTTEVVRN